MIVVPEDPVQVWIDRAHKFALLLMDDYPIIMPGNMSSHPNEISLLGIGYEYLESEVPIAARQLSRLIERTHKQLLPVLISQRIRQLRAKRPVRA